MSGSPRPATPVLEPGLVRLFGYTMLRAAAVTEKASRVAPLAPRSEGTTDLPRVPTLARWISRSTQPGPVGGLPMKKRNTNSHKHVERISGGELCSDCAAKVLEFRSIVGPCTNPTSKCSHNNIKLQPVFFKAANTWIGPAKNLGIAPCGLWRIPCSNT